MANGSETGEREGGTESSDVGSGGLFSLHVVDLPALLFFFVRSSSQGKNRFFSTISFFLAKLSTTQPHKNKS